MARKGFKPGDQVIITKIIPDDNYDSWGIVEGQIYTIESSSNSSGRSAYYLVGNKYIGFNEECEYAQPYLNELKLKKVLGL